MQESVFRYRVEHPACNSCVPWCLVFRQIYQVYLLINAGKRIKALTKIQTRPIERSNPKLAVPSCGEIARLPKLAAVVSELKTTARAVLDFRNSKCVRVSEKR